MVLSVVYDESVAEVADSITVEIPACRAVGDGADIVQVVGASATVALGVAANLQYKRLCDVVVLVAVGAGSVVTDNSRIVFTNLRNRKTSYDEATQTEGVTAITDQTYDVDG